MTKKFGVALPDELGGWLDNQLEYGDSRSEWMRSACELRKMVDEVLVKREMAFPTEQEKRHFVRQAVINEIDRQSA